MSTSKTRGEDLCEQLEREQYTLEFEYLSNNPNEIMNWISEGNLVWKRLVFWVEDVKFHQEIYKKLTCLKGEAYLRHVLEDLEDFDLVERVGRVLWSLVRIALHLFPFPLYSRD